MKTYLITYSKRAKLSANGNPAIEFHLADESGRFIRNVKTKANANFVYGITQLSHGASAMFDGRRYITAELETFRGKLRMVNGRPASEEEIGAFKADKEAAEIAHSIAREACHAASLEAIRAGVKARKALAL